MSLSVSAIEQSIAGMPGKRMKTSAGKSSATKEADERLGKGNANKLDAARMSAKRVDVIVNAVRDEMVFKACMSRVTCEDVLYAACGLVPEQFYACGAPLEQVLQSEAHLYSTIITSSLAYISNVIWKQGNGAPLLLADGVATKCVGNVPSSVRSPTSTVIPYTKSSYFPHVVMLLRDMTARFESYITETCADARTSDFEIPEPVRIEWREQHVWHIMRVILAVALCEYGTLAAYELMSIMLNITPDLVQVYSWLDLPLSPYIWYTRRKVTVEVVDHVPWAVINEWNNVMQDLVAVSDSLAVLPPQSARKYTRCLGHNPFEMQRRLIDLICGYCYEDEMAFTHPECLNHTTFTVDSNNNSTNDTTGQRRHDSAHPVVYRGSLHCCQLTERDATESHLASSTTFLARGADRKKESDHKSAAASHTTASQLVDGPCHCHCPLFTRHATRPVCTTLYFPNVTHTESYGIIRGLHWCRLPVRTASGTLGRRPSSIIMADCLLQYNSVVLPYRYPKEHGVTMGGTADASAKSSANNDNNNSSNSRKHRPVAYTAWQIPTPYGTDMSKRDMYMMNWMVRWREMCHLRVEELVPLMFHTEGASVALLKLATAAITGAEYDMVLAPRYADLSLANESLYPMTSMKLTRSMNSPDVHQYFARNWLNAKVAVAVSLAPSENIYDRTGLVMSWFAPGLKGSPFVGQALAIFADNMATLAKYPSTLLVDDTVRGKRNRLRLAAVVFDCEILSARLRREHELPEHTSRLKL